MTREQNFRLSVRMQLNGFAGWSIVEPQEIKRLPAQSFTSFSIELGRAYTMQSDFWGRILVGKQDFTLRIYIRFDQQKLTAAFQLRSDVVATIQLFFNGFYAPPVIMTGESERIDKAVIDTIERADIDPSQTRHEIIVRGSYYFTQF